MVQEHIARCIDHDLDQFICHEQEERKFSTASFRFRLIELAAL